MASTAGAAASSFVKAAAHHAVNAMVQIHLEGIADNNTETDDVPKVIPEEDYHKSRVVQVNFSCWFLTALATLFLGLRIYCKRYRGRGLWWDDWVLIISWISLITSTALTSYSTTLGFALPTSLFNPLNQPHVLNHYLLITNMCGTFSILAALWSKTSFAITVLRISQDSWMRFLIWFIMLTVNLSLGVAVALTWGQCDPIPKIWQPSLDGSCMDKGYQIRYNIFTAIYSGAMDIVLAVLPWKIIWILTMNHKEKFGVLVAMSMGIFAGVTSIVKATELPTIGNENFTFASTNLMILGIAESAITIMAASIPILRALLREHRGGPRPPPPAEFYNLDSLENQHHVQQMGEEMEMYAGTEGTQGTGRSSTTVNTNRTGRSKRYGLFGSLTGSKGSRDRSQGSKDEEAGNGHVVHVHHLHAESGGNGRPAMMRRLSRLSSALSVGTAGETGSRGESDTVHQRSVSGKSHNHGHGGVGTVHLVMDPPPGKIVKEREVTIEYDTRSPTPDTHTHTDQRTSEWPSYPSQQGSDADLAHVPALRPWGDNDNGNKESMGRR